MKSLRIEHTTEYAFATAVSLLPHRVLVRPRGSHNLRIASSTLEISPAATLHWHRDALDNSVAIATFGLRYGPIETLVLLDRLNRALHDAFHYGTCPGRAGKASTRPQASSPASITFRSRSRIIQRPCRPSRAPSSDRNRNR